MRKNNKKYLNLKKIVFFFLYIILIIIIIKSTVSRFQSDVNAVAKLDTAFYIVKEDYQTMDIKLDSIVPRKQVYEYNFSISNNDGTNRAEVNLEYDLSVVATTNLPLEYKLYMNGDFSTNIITEDIVEPDEYGTYFKTMKTAKKSFGFTQDQTNTYRLTIEFPQIYKDIKYQDVIEGIEIRIDSRQIIT